MQTSPVTVSKSSAESTCAASIYLPFFSAHTAIAVLAVTEIARAGRRWLTGLGVLIAIFEILTVLVLRVHYTMDVFTGIVTGLYAAYLAECISTALKSNKISAKL